MRQAIVMGGAWRAADDGGAYGMSDPASGELIGTVPWAGAVETRPAIVAAQGAFKGWSMKLAGPGTIEQE